MATTGLFVEIIVIGMLAEVWLATAFLALLLKVVRKYQIQSLMCFLVGIKDFAPVVAVVLLAFTYAIGWIVNFATAELFGYLFQDKWRLPLFKGKDGKDHYEEDRALVFQHGSSEALQDLFLDRHVVRIARSNVLNFFLLALALRLHASRLQSSVLIVAISISFLLAGLSFWQWRARYKGLYGRLADIAAVIRKDKVSGGSNFNA